MKKKFYKKVKEQKAITLIALIVTIVILLILAGVTIAMLTGENGILKRASDAKEKQEEAKTQEESRLADYVNVIDNTLDSSRGNTNGIYIVKRWTDNYNYYTIYSDGWVEQGGFVDGNTAIKTITLFIKYANTNYNIQATSSYAVGDTTLYSPHISNITVSEFKSASYGERGYATNVVGAPVYWSTEGYGDQTEIQKVLNNK